jgi:hypothetical protein
MMRGLRDARRSVVRRAFLFGRPRALVGLD